MSLIGDGSAPVTPFTGSVAVTRWTDRPWWTVADAARLLRVHTDTLYDACASGDFPHSNVGPYIRIPAEALLLTPLPDTNSRDWHSEALSGQLELFLDPQPIPIRRYRNGDSRAVGDYEASLSKKKWRNPLT